MQTKNPIDRLLQITCLTFFAIMLPAFVVGQEIVVTPSFTNPIAEGSSGNSFTVTLDADPGGDVLVNATTLVSGITITTSLPETLNSGNYNTGVIIQFDSAEDPNVISESGVITVSAPSYTNKDIPISIADNDDAVLSITPIADIDENTTANGFTIAIDKVLATDLDVDVSISGGSASLADYTDPSGTYTIAAGQLSVLVPITTTDDAVVEGDETITLQIADPVVTNVALGTASASISIIDDDSAVLSIAPIADIDENTTANGFTISIDKVLATNLDVDVSISGGSASLADYSDPSGTYTIDAGQLSVTIPITTTDDAVVEGNETITLQIADPAVTNVALGTTTASISIIDDDSAVLSIAPIADIDENTTTNGFTISIDKVLATNLDVDVSISGGSASLADYTDPSGTYTITAGQSSVTIPITTTDDAVVEGNETITLQIADPAVTNVALGTASASISITDDDSAVLSIAPIADIDENTTANGFTISIDKVLATDLDVDVSISGGSASLADYTDPSGTYTITAGQSSVTIPITTTDDAVVEGNETITLQIADPAVTNVALGTASASISITDDDKSVISIVATTQAEEDNTNGQFTINITPALVGDATINYTVSGTALNGTDYTTINSSIDLNNGATSATIPVTVTTDALVEGSETVIITLDTQTNDNATIGGSNTATVTITDNDKSVISIDATTQAEEDITDGLFTINIAPALVGDATINYTVSGTAQNGTDYTTINSSIDLNSGATSATIPVTVSTDALVEGSETVIITLETQTNDNATIGGNNSATITITDSDGNLTITDASTVNGTEGGANGSFTINTSRQFAVPTTITVTTSNNSAVIGDDFSIGTISLPANQSSIVVHLTIVDDNLAEGNETVDITLNAVTGNANAHIPVADISTSITITDNETPGLNITGGPFTINEATSNHTFDVGLTAQPLTPVTVNISSVNPDITFNPSTVTFTNGDWADKSISFSAADDNDLISESDPIIISVDNATSDDLFDNLTESIDLTVTDTDDADIVITGGPFTVAEGSTNNTFSVALAAQPASNVVIDISSDNDDIVFTPTSLTFTNADWGNKDVSFTANEDVDLIDEMNPIIVAVNNASSDDNFDNQSSTISLTVNDNDEAELSIAATNNADEDATSGSFTITASQAVLGDVEITLNIGGSAIMGTDFETINNTITIADGTSSQSIPVNLLPDNLVEGLETVTINLVSDNNAKAAITTGSGNTATINITDNDIADIVVSQSSFSINEGTIDHTFNIALSAQPQSDVVIDVVSNNPDIVLSSSSLTFTNANYGNQAITFSCSEDDDLSDETANIAISVNNTLSNSLFYDLNSQVSIDIADNDTQPVFESTPITVTNEDAVYTYNISVSDTDGDIPVITMVTPANPADTWLNLTDNNDGTAILSGTPLQVDVTGSGAPLSVTLRAEDDLTFIEQLFTITVNNVNDSPQINSSSFSTPENQALTISLSSFANDEDDNLDPTTLTDRKSVV